MCVFSSIWPHSPRDPCFGWLRKACLLPSFPIQAADTMSIWIGDPWNRLEATGKRVTGKWQHFSPLGRASHPFFCARPRARAVTDIREAPEPGKLNSVLQGEGHMGVSQIWPKSFIHEL